MYLIAHKVRGEPAIDVAEKLDGTGWFIIPTSGHRAYPYWWVEVSALLVNQTPNLRPSVIELIPSMPDDAIEHYEVSAAPKGKGKVSGRNLLVELGLAKPIEPLKRRSW